MAEPSRIPVRELRNHVSDVLRRVENGETLEVTVNDRPVALLVPRDPRPTTMPADQFFADLRQADPALRDELAEFEQMTDELDDPWQK
jgi:prevent-host-death family protein